MALVSGSCGLTSRAGRPTGGRSTSWGRRFDPATGTPVGEEFRVTRFENPGRVLDGSSLAELGVSRTRLVVPITETSGSVCVLDNVGR
jgi:hypothetical protein